MIRALLVAFAVMAAALWQPSLSRAGDADDFQRIITEQISAFNADDGTRAFSYATPTLQQMFATSENFMNMVKKGYQPVYRQKSYKFAEVSADSVGRPIQKVVIVDANGKVWTAIYSFEKQADGTWKIGGCQLVEPDGADA